jgi:hypothetical protein
MGKHKTHPNWHGTCSAAGSNQGPGFKPKLDIDLRSPAHLQQRKIAPGIIQENFDMGSVVRSVTGGCPITGSRSFDCALPKIWIIVERGKLEVACSATPIGNYPLTA